MLLPFDCVAFRCPWGITGDCLWSLGTWIHRRVAPLGVQKRTKPLGRTLAGVRSFLCNMTNLCSRLATNFGSHGVKLKDIDQIFDGSGPRSLMVVEACL